MKPLRLLLALAALAAPAAACGGKAGSGAAEPGGGSAMATAPTGATDPGAAPTLDAIEARLLAERVLVIGFSIRSEGTVASKVDGDLTLTADNRARWRVSGTIAGQPVSIDKKLDATAGDHLAEAIILGWTRMGLLHNIVVLSRGGSIEHTEGGMADFVTARPAAGGDATHVHVDLVVQGNPMGNAELELDSLALPALRHQTVQFPEGEMKVVEQYSVSVPDVVPAGAF